MKPSESVRYCCDECMVVFDLCLAPRSEWPEEAENDEDLSPDIEPSCCPFCGAHVTQLRLLHDRPTQIWLDYGKSGTFVSEIWDGRNRTALNFRRKLIPV